MIHDIELLEHGQSPGLRAQGWLLMGQWPWLKAPWPEVSQQKSGVKSQSSWPHGFISRPWILNLSCKNIAICLWISWNYRNCIFEWQAPKCHDKRCIWETPAQQIQFKTLIFLFDMQNHSHMLTNCKHFQESELWGSLDTKSFWKILNVCCFVQVFLVYLRNITIYKGGWRGWVVGSYFGALFV